MEVARNPVFFRLPQEAKLGELVGTELVDRLVVQRMLEHDRLFVNFEKVWD